LFLVSFFRDILDGTAEFADIVTSGTAL